jgi:hypothetical protein
MGWYVRHIWGGMFVIFGVVYSSYLGWYVRHIWGGISLEA